MAKFDSGDERKKELKKQVNLLVRTGSDVTQALVSLAARVDNLDDDRRATILWSIYNRLKSIPARK